MGAGVAGYGSGEFAGGYREAVVKFRHRLRENGKIADAGAFKEHLDSRKSYLAPEKYEVRRQALRGY